jgi:hypothetical protein
LSLATGENNFYRKTDFLGTSKILQKSIIPGEIFGHFLDAEVPHIFEISTKFRFL